MILQVFVDEQTYRTLFLVSERTGRPVRDLAEAAIIGEASKTREWREVLPPAHRSLDETLGSALHISGYRK